MNRRAFFRNIGLTMATMAVVPDIALKEITKEVKPDLRTALLWQEQLLEQQARLNLAMEEYLLFGRVLLNENGEYIPGGVYKEIGWKEINGQMVKAEK